MTLTNQIDYALREMLYLAKSDQLSWTSTRKIADEMQIPATFLSRINMQLVNARLLESQRGARGGVRPAKMPPASRSMTSSAPSMDLSCSINV